MQLARVPSRLLIAGVMVIAFLIPQLSHPQPLLQPTAIIASRTSAQLGAPYTPQQIQAAYDYTGLYSQGFDGSGQTVALIEIDTYAPGDLRQFDQTYSIAAPTIRATYIGRRFSLRVEGEADMDIEWVHALAPGATIHVYYLDPNLDGPAEWKALAKAVRQAWHDGARTISISLAACTADTGSADVRSSMQTVRKHGVSIFVSSGDDGDHAGTVRDCGSQPGVGYPGGDPSVVAVGGTSLRLNQDSTIDQETAWSRSGGGLVSYMPRPVWQVAPSLPTGTTRWAPDVSFLGDPNTGAALVYRGRLRYGGGTSLGAPAWAAAWALIRQDAQENSLKVGAAPKVLYRIANSSLYPTTFHDVVAGSNGSYQAGPGWDAVTGWGTPDVAALGNAIVGGS